jgi:hypothetical protein
MALYRRRQRVQNKVLSTKRKLLRNKKKARNVNKNQEKEEIWREIKRDSCNSSEQCVYQAVALQGAHVASASSFPRLISLYDWLRNPLGWVTRAWQAGSREAGGSVRHTDKT